MKIYLLRCPITGNVKYIGKTSQTLEKRLQGHVNDKVTKKKVEWLNLLKVSNLKPTIELIELVNEREQFLQREQFWIKFYNEQNELINTLDINERKTKSIHMSVRIPKEINKKELMDEFKLAAKKNKTTANKLIINFIKTYK